MLRFLKVRLEAITDDFNNGIKAAQKEAKEFEKTIRPSKELLLDIGLAATAAGVAVVGSMTAMAKAAANYGDELLDASKRTGASVQELARLKFAAEQSGASFNDVSTGLRVLARNLDEAATKTGAQRKAFQDLDVSVTDSTGKLRPMNDVLLDVADRFSRMEDGAEKAALAQEIFGRGGAALIPVLNEGRDGLRAMGDQAERLGLVISRDAAVAADEFNDTLEEIKGATLGLANAIGTAILPSLTSMAAKARDGIVAFKDFSKEHENLTKAIYATAVAITGAGGLLVGLSGVLAIAPKVKVAIEALNVPLLGAASAFAAVGGAAFVFRKELGIGLLMVLEQVTPPLAKFFDILSSASDVIGNGRLAVQFNTTANSIRDFKTSITDNLNALAEMELTIPATAKQLEALQASSVKAGGGFRVTAEEAKRALAAWNDLQEAQERLRESTMDVIAATNQARRELGAADIARILEGIATRSRMAATGFDEWVASVEDGTAVLLGLARQLQNNPLSFDRLVLGDQDIWRRNADNRTQIFGDALQKMNGLAVTHATFMGRTLSKPAEEMSKAFATALGNVTSGLAHALTDSLFKARDFGDAVVGIAKSVSQNVLNALLVGLLSPLTEKLAGLGAQLGGIFGGAGSAAGSVAGGAGSAAGSVGGAAGGVGGATGGLASGLIGAAGGILGGVISGLMGARQEGTLNAVEFNTRASEIHLRSMIDQILWPIRGDVLAIRESAHLSTTQLDAIFNAIAGGGTTSSRVTSASMSSTAPAPQATVQLVSNFAPVIHVDGLPEDWQTIFRERISPELMEAFRLNFRGSLDEMIRLLRSSGFVPASA